MISRISLSFISGWLSKEHPLRDISHLFGYLLIEKEVLYCQQWHRRSDTEHNVEHVFIGCVLRGACLYLLYQSIPLIAIRTPCLLTLIPKSLSSMLSSFSSACSQSEGNYNRNIALKSVSDHVSSSPSSADSFAADLETLYMWNSSWLLLRHDPDRPTLSGDLWPESCSVKLSNSTV